MKQNLGYLYLALNTAVHVLNGQSALGQIFEKHWRISKCNSLAFWKSKVTVFFSQHTVKVYWVTPKDEEHVIDFHKFHWSYFVKTEMIMFPFFPLSCCFVKEAVFYCVCLVQWSWKLNSNLLNSDGDPMEKFTLPMLSISHSEGTSPQTVNFSRAPNVTGGIEGWVFPQTTEIQAIK